MHRWIVKYVDISQKLKEHWINTFGGFEVTWISEQQHRTIYFEGRNCVEKDSTDLRKVEDISKKWQSLLIGWWQRVRRKNWDGDITQDHHDDLGLEEKQGLSHMSGFPSVRLYRGRKREVCSLSSTQVITNERRRLWRRKREKTSLSVCQQEILNGRRTKKELSSGRRDDFFLVRDDIFETRSRDTWGMLDKLWLTKSERSKASIIQPEKQLLREKLSLLRISTTVALLWRLNFQSVSTIGGVKTFPLYFS